MASEIIKVVPDALAKLWLTLMTNVELEADTAFEAMVSAIIINMGIPVTSDVSTVEIHDYITAHCNKTGEIPFAHDWTLVDGCLCMDGNFVKRVGSKDPRPNTDAFWNFMESRIGYCRTE